MITDGKTRSSDQTYTGGGEADYGLDSRRQLHGDLGGLCRCIQELALRMAEAWQPAG